MVKEPITVQGKALELDLASYMKINSKWIINLNTSVKTRKKQRIKSL